MKAPVRPNWASDRRFSVFFVQESMSFALISPKIRTKVLASSGQVLGKVIIDPLSPLIIKRRGSLICLFVLNHGHIS